MSSVTRSTTDPSLVVFNTVTGGIFGVWSEWGVSPYALFRMRARVLRWYLFLTSCEFNLHFSIIEMQDTVPARRQPNSAWEERGGGVG